MGRKLITKEPTMKTLSVDDSVCVAIASQPEPLKFITEDLRKLGYTSKTGVKLTESHVSNFRRKDLGIRSAPVYHKPNYQGRNWITG